MIRPPPPVQPDRELAKRYREAVRERAPEFEAGLREFYEAGLIEGWRSVQKLTIDGKEIK